MRSSKKRATAVLAAFVVSVTVIVSGGAASAATPPMVKQSTANMDMSPAFVAEADGNASTGVTAATSALNTNHGDMLVAFVAWDNTSDVHLSDQLNTWTAATPRQVWGPQLHYAAQSFYTFTAGGAVNVKATFKSALSTFGEVHVAEYANVAGVDAATARRGHSTTMTVPALTTMQPGDLLFAAGASTGTVMPAAAGWTTRSTSFGNLVADMTAGDAGAYSTTMTQNGTKWALQMLALMPAMPMDGVQDQCTFTTFCDNFAAASPGGRGGDLDESKWSLSRESQETNAGQGLVDKFFPSSAEFCMVHGVQRMADNDSFICGQQFGESNHWMEAIYDNGFFMSHAARIVQPFDFANRKGTLDFSVDARSTGGVGSWVEVWLTDQPVQSPHVQEDAITAHAYPRNGIGLVFDAPEHCAGGVVGQQANSLREVDLFNNYALTALPANSQCFSTQDDTPNHFQIKVDVNHVEVWASDAGGSNFRQVAGAKFPSPLSFTRGYWNLEHVQYNASNANMPLNNAPNNFTYHWHAVSFDGPAVTPDHDYQVPDSLLPTCAGANGVCGVNVGYTMGCWQGLPLCTNWSLPGVDKTGATAAYLTYDVQYTCCDGTSLNVTVNGHTHVVPDPDPNVGSAALDAWRYAILPIPLSELRAGTNTISMDVNHCNGSCPSVANIDLELTRS